MTKKDLLKIIIETCQTVYEDDADISVYDLAEDILAICSGPGQSKRKD